MTEYWAVIAPFLGTREEYCGDAFSKLPDNSSIQKFLTTAQTLIMSKYAESRIAELAAVPEGC